MTRTFGQIAQSDRRKRFASPLSQTLVLAGEGLAAFKILGATPYFSYTDEAAESPGAVGR